MNKILIAFLSVGFLIVPPVFAKRGSFGGEVVIDGEPIENDLFTSGGNVIVRSPVVGDLFAAGGNVSVEGSVEGDLFAAGGSVHVKGNVEEDARLCGGEMQIDGPIGRNASVFGGSVVVGENGRVGRDLKVGCGELKVAGTIERDLTGSADHVVLSGIVRGDVEIQAEEVILLPETQILGNFEYTSSKEAEIQEGVLIQGETTHRLPEVKEKKKDGKGLFSILFKLISLGALLLIGILSILLSPKQVEHFALNIRRTPWKSLGLGILLLIAIPAVVGVLTLTLIGIPAAFFLLILYLFLLYTSKLYTGIMIGQFILKSGGREEKGRLIGALVLGMVILAILTSIPYVGKGFWILSILFGLGAILLERLHLYREGKEKGLV